MLKSNRKRPYGILTASFTLAFSLLSAAYTFANPGDLDPTFNFDSDGTARALNQTLAVLAPQFDGNFVVGGISTDRRGNTGFQIARFKPDGTIDRRFGKSGLTFVDATRFDEVLIGLRVAPDGKIVAVGYSTDFQMLVIRLTVDGKLDRSFGVRGVAVSFGLNVAADVAFQSDGKILVVGGGYYGGAQAIVRYNGDGTIDRSFGTSGMVSLSPYFYTTSFFGEIVIQPDGKIIVGGSVLTSGPGPGSQDWVIIRMERTGSLDTSFASGGIFVHRIDSDNVMNFLQLRGDGSILFGGYVGSQLTQLSSAAIGCLDPMGNFVLTFGTSGVVLLSQGQRMNGYQIAFQDTGQIVLGGTTVSNFSAPTFFLARFSFNGTLDTSLGISGIVYSNFEFEPLAGIFFQSSNRLVVGGSSFVGVPVIARYEM